MALRAASGRGTPDCCSRPGGEAYPPAYHEATFHIDPSSFLCPVLEADFIVFDFSPLLVGKHRRCTPAAARTCFDTYSRLRFRSLQENLLVMITYHIVKILRISCPQEVASGV